jgi:UDP-glucose 4-epimerase
LQTDCDRLDSLPAVSAIIHLAATVSIPACQADPLGAEANNVGVTLSLLEWAKKRAAQGQKLRLLFASSAAVYGRLGEHGRPLQEDTLPSRFLSFYAAHKAASEQHCALYAEHFAVPTLCFRFFNVYGKGQDLNSPYSGVISRFMRFLEDGQPLRLEGGGRAIRDFVHLDDIVAGIEAALKLSAAELQGQAVNLASGHSISVRELAERMVQAYTRAHAKTASLQDAPARVGDVRESRADISLARQLLGFEPRVGLDEGLAGLI